MTTDALLLWMSARGSGSWQQFRGAVEGMHLSAESDLGVPADTDGTDSLPLYQLFRLNLERLGHAEFFSGGAGVDWRIVPPVLAIAGSGPNALGVLTGARSPRGLRRVRETFGDLLQEAVLDAYPTQITVRGGAPELDALAKQAGLLVQQDAPLSVLLSLPPVDNLLAWRRTDLPFGAAWAVERFSVSALSWKSSDRNEAARVAAGLFRFSFRHERRTLYCTRGDAREIGIQPGKYLLLKRRRRRVLVYDRQARTISVPPICRPPLLVERALILCSGLPPAFEPATAQLVYAGVPERVARVAAQLLRQDL